jgi:endonuclease/exonuclease/phosphatase family metal-dependent hydrolase
MRIVSYNILDGGEGRADPLGEVIEAQRADVVALVEATDLAVVERIARRLNMDFIHAPGNTQASALLTRWTLRQTVNHALVHTNALEKSLLEALVIDPAGNEWTLGVVHLHAHAKESDEAARERELAVVLDVFRPHREAGKPHVLCGDFNANSPVQKIDPAQCKPSTQEAWTANGGHIPRRVVQTLLDQGYVDTLHAARGEEATTAGTFSTQHPGQRVDYLFTHGIAPDRLKHAWIEYDRLAKYASDHFPVGVEIA